MKGIECRAGLVKFCINQRLNDFLFLRYGILNYINDGYARNFILKKKLEIKQLLPLKRADFAAMHIPVDAPREELALVPSAEAVMDRIVPDYLVGFVYGALVEAFSCEQNARMMAMENATNSAKDMLHELDILYNRARQEAIKQEITEVIAGAKAQKRKKKR